MAGNVVLWKPSDTAMLSGWLVYKILRESGLPDGIFFIFFSEIALRSGPIKLNQGGAMNL